MSRSASLASAAIACSACLNACLTPIYSRDVSSDRQYRVGFVPGQVYELKQDLVLYAPFLGEGSKEAYAPVHPEGGGWSVEVPPNYLILAPPDRLDRPVISDLTAGSRIRVDKLRKNDFVTLSDVDRFVAAYGILLDGSQAGHTVALTYVSVLKRVYLLDTVLVRVQAPNAAFIAPVAR